ncbi:MAG: hypothetical protein ACI9DH_000114 [Halioglobus sp.]|jgi:hypothetical protein
MNTIHNLLSTTLTLAITLLFIAGGAQAEQSKMFDNYELHYSVVNTTFIEPEVAANYGIVRGEKRGIINLAVLDTETEKNVPVSMLLKGRTWDLIQNQFLEFREVREGKAIYYIADFKFINEEWRFFEFDFRPEGATESYTFKFRHQLYIN